MFFLKQFFLVKGPLGAGKSLFLRSVLYEYLENNEELRNIYYNEAEFIFFNVVDPLINTFPYIKKNIFLFKEIKYIKKSKRIMRKNKFR